MAVLLNQNKVRPNRGDVEDAAMYGGDHRVELSIEAWIKDKDKDDPKVRLHRRNNVQAIAITNIDYEGRW